MGIIPGRTLSKVSLYLGIAAAVALSAVALFDRTGMVGLICLGLAAVILLLSIILR